MTDRMSTVGGRVVPRGDGGQVLLLTLAYGLIALLLVVVVAAVTSIYLQRKELLSVADAAALDAADAADEPAYFDALTSNTDVVFVPLTDDSVRDGVRAYLASLAGRPGGAGVRAVAIDESATGTDDGTSAIVVLTGVATLPVVSSVLEGAGSGIALRVRTEAQAPLVP